MNSTVQIELDKLKELIINAIPVEQIHLFGSYAYGTLHKDSDLEMKVINKIYIFLLIPFIIISCDYDGLNTDNSQTENTIKIYSGNYGYEVAYRVDGNKVYSGSYGYNVAYRIDGNKIYSGSYGYNTAFRIDGEKIYSGSYGYETAYRIDGSKVYSGSFGYTVVYRIDR